VSPAQRAQLQRYAAPAAFLAAVTVAVLLVKAGLNGNRHSTTAALPTTKAQTSGSLFTTTKLVLTTPAQTPAATSTTTGAGRYYVIQDGDTLGSIAARYGTTVDQLVTLNPGLDPTALQPGQRLRVG
jgi:LysM repeat protein